MSTAWHCDGPDCWTWAVTITPDSGWLRVEWGTRVLHFCYWDCLLRYAAEQEPLVTIPAGGL